jgi:hypothetical protein
VTREVEVAAESVGALRDGPACDWYVDDVLGGNSSLGTITQDNPATYTAPYGVPGDGRVTITAVSRDDSSLSDSDTLAVAFTVTYVDPANGNDVVGSGRWTSPLRTLVHALWVAEPGDTVFATPGTYDAGSGEAGLYLIPDDVALVGAGRESCFLYGSGSEFRVVDLGDGATFDGFTVRNGGDDQIAVLSMNGGVIRNVVVEEPFMYAAIRADGDRSRVSDVVIEDCALTNTAEPATGRGIEAYYGTHCTVRRCEVEGWQTGVYVNRDSDPLIERTNVTGNVFGIIYAGGGGLVIGPDLGGGPRDSEGGNTIAGNTLIGLSNQTAATIWALSNTWTNDPPTEGPPYPSDLQNTAGGAIIVSE